MFPIKKDEHEMATDLKNDRLVVFLEIESKDISVFKCVAT